jgi:predicted  nucleic acid-binding Zn-ribbon protein
MARSKNGNGKFDEEFRELLQAQARLVHAQAALVDGQAAVGARIAAAEERIAAGNDRITAGNDRMIKIESEIAETNKSNAERFARIEALLLEHNRILEALPEKLRDKFGFHVPEKS